MSVINASISNTISNTKFVEPPILGATTFFELIRSSLINGPKSVLKIDPSASANLKNQYEPSGGLVNYTNYNGFYYRPGATINFRRNSIANTNPYILLTSTHISDNAKGVEQDFTTQRNTANIKAAVVEYWNRLATYDELVNIEDKGAINHDSKQNYKGFFPNMHLMFAYMIENTKIFQVFEKVISKYQLGEDLTIPYNNKDVTSRLWIENTNLLFFANSPYSVWDEFNNNESSFDSTRRNAYYRLFGMDLNHGIGENNTKLISYQRANHFNSSFIEQLETFLKLCWQMMINYNNTSNVNTTDLIALQEQANSLRSLLLSRRTTENNFKDYTLLNLSKVEYHSVVMAEWFHHAISYNSPIIMEMGAEGVTPAERLNRLAQKVGMNSHSKSSNFLDLAPLLATLLRLLELNEIDNSYLNAIANPLTRPYALITSILYNYQQATGKDLKNQVMLTNRNIMLNKMATV